VHTAMIKQLQKEWQGNTYKCYYDRGSKVTISRWTHKREADARPRDMLVQNFHGNVHYSKMLFGRQVVPNLACPPSQPRHGSHWQLRS